MANGRAARPAPISASLPTASTAKAAARACIASLADYTSKTAKTHSGVWRDLAVRKRRTEVEY